jgi:hypothetical protein
MGCLRGEPKEVFGLVEIAARNVLLVWRSAHKDAVDLNGSAGRNGSDT